MAPQPCMVAIGIGLSFQVAPAGAPESADPAAARTSSERQCGAGLVDSTEDGLDEHERLEAACAQTVHRGEPTLEADHVILIVPQMTGSP